MGGFFIANPANRKVKSGKFDCRVESLSVLLDYRWDIKLFCNIPIRTLGSRVADPNPPEFALFLEAGYRFGSVLQLSEKLGPDPH